MKALILCAGKGTRLGYKTKPKCMAIVNGKPILEHLVNHLKRYGVRDIIVNLHIHPEKVMKHFGTKLIYFYEPEPLGEKKTIRALKKWLGSEFFLMNGDTITNINLGKMYLRWQNHLPAKFTNLRNGHYAGTMIYSKICKDSQKPWNGDGAYYYDCGTPQKLAKARRFLCKKR